jgi:hypothetical protein
MLLFVIDGALFQLDAQRPLFEPLFQVPPTMRPRDHHGPTTIPDEDFAFPFFSGRKPFELPCQFLLQIQTVVRVICLSDEGRPASKKFAVPGFR